jgi:hypothetical protein
VAARWPGATVAVALAVLGLHLLLLWGLRAVLAPAPALPAPAPGPVLLLRWPAPAPSPAAPEAALNERQAPPPPPAAPRTVPPQGLSPDPLPGGSTDPLAQAEPEWLPTPAPPEPVPVAPEPVQPVDRPALPITAPDFRPVLHLPNSGAPIRLRLYISAQGQVQQVQVLDCAAADTAFAQQIAAVLQATPHVPARRQGQDVASVKTVELGFSPVRPTAPARALAATVTSPSAPP